MNFKNKSDWYSITINEIRNYGGSGLLNKYNNSLQHALKSIYPNYEWIPWKFQTSKNFWSNIENQRKYFNWLSNQLNIKSNEDWYNIKIEQIISLYSSSLLNKYYDGSLYLALKSIYPNYEWIPWKFQ